MTTLTAAVLALAVGGVPLAADWCAVSCDASHANRTAAAPACHHASAPTPRIGQRPAPCGHDHHPVVVDAATTTVIVSRALPAIAASSINGAAAASIADAPALRRDRAVRPDAPFPLTLAFALRV